MRKDLNAAYSSVRSLGSRAGYEVTYRNVQGFKFRSMMYELRRSETSCAARRLGGRRPFQEIQFLAMAQGWFDAQALNSHGVAICDIRESRRLLYLLVNVKPLESKFSQFMRYCR
jgi:hypothetical protein